MTAADRLAQAAKAYLPSEHDERRCEAVFDGDKPCTCGHDALEAALAAYESSKKRCETCGGDGWILVREGADGPAIDTADCPDCASGKETR